jgi:hypothetical protein
MPKYPKPDRTNHKEQQNAKSDFYPEIDIAKGEVLLDDDRPAIVEDWFDIDTRAELRTIFYSTSGIEEWKTEDHLDYLLKNKIMKSKDDTIEPRKYIDPGKNEIWSIRWLLRMIED